MIALILLLLGLVFKNNVDVGPLARVIGKFFFGIGLLLIILYVIVILITVIAAIVALLSL